MSADSRSWLQVPLIKLYQARLLGDDLVCFGFSDDGGARTVRLRQAQRRLHLLVEPTVYISVALDRPKAAEMFD